jgi:hypothetical protein
MISTLQEKVSYYLTNESLDIEGNVIFIDTRKEAAGCMRGEEAVKE